MTHYTEEIVTYRATVPAGLLNEFTATTHESFWSSLARLVSMDRHDVHLAEAALGIWKRSKLLKGNARELEPRGIDLEIPAQTMDRFTGWAGPASAIQSHWLAVALIAAMLEPTTKVESAYERRCCCG